MSAKQVTSASAARFNDVAVHAAASYAPDRASIEDAMVTWQNQSLRISGGVLPQLGLSAKADRVSITAILARLNQADVPASGELSLSAEVTGTMDRPAAAVTLTGANLQAYQEMLDA